MLKPISNQNNFARATKVTKMKKKRPTTSDEDKLTIRNKVTIFCFSFAQCFGWPNDSIKIQKFQAASSALGFRRGMKYDEQASIAGSMLIMVFLLVTLRFLLPSLFKSSLLLGFLSSIQQMLYPA